MHITREVSGHSGCVYTKGTTEGSDGTTEIQRKTIIKALSGKMSEDIKGEAEHLLMEDFDRENRVYRTLEFTDTESLCYGVEIVRFNIYIGYFKKEMGETGLYYDADRQDCV